MMKSSQKIFDSTVVTSKIWTWWIWVVKSWTRPRQPFQFNYDEVKVSIRPWQSRFKRSWIQPRRHLLFGHNKGESESVRFGYGDLSDFGHGKAESKSHPLGYDASLIRSQWSQSFNSTMTKTSQKVFDSAMAASHIQPLWSWVQKSSVRPWHLSFYSVWPNRTRGISSFILIGWTKWKDIEIFLPLLGLIE